MLVAKIERPGGLWDYLEFDTTPQIAKYLIKNPGTKLRVVLNSDNRLLEEVKGIKSDLDEKRSNRGVSR